MPSALGIAVVGTNAVLPAGRQFERAAFALPPGRRVLPDVLDGMSSEQLLAVMGCHDLIGNLLEHGVEPARIGVVLSGFRKAERAKATNDFVYEPRFRRLMMEAGGVAGADAQWASACDRYYARGRGAIPETGPYTLAGIMPNVASGRVAHMYGLNGPNVVLGEAEPYAAEFLALAAKYVVFGDADVVVCGAMDLAEVRGGVVSGQDGIIVFAVTTPAFAREHGLDVVSFVAPDATIDASSAA
jgi:hypothetical protein